MSLRRLNWVSSADILPSGYDISDSGVALSGPTPASPFSLFVAVAINGTGNRVMTSPDGITWTSRTSAADNAWRSVCFSE